MSNIVSENKIVRKLSSFRKMKWTLKDYLPDSELSEDPEELFNLVLERNKLCRNCVLSETRNHVVGPDGKFGAPIMVVLEGPGFLEDLTKIPLTGPQQLKSSHCNLCSNVYRCFDQRISFAERKRPVGKKRPITCEPNYTGNRQIDVPVHMYSSGAVFDGLLQSKYGGVFPRESWRQNYLALNGEEYPFLSPWFITNAVQCRAWNPSELRDEQPGTLSVNQCRSWLGLQWATLQPKVIVAMGRVALSSIIGNDKLAKSTPFDTLIIDEKLGPIIYTKHPAANMRIRDPHRQAIGHAKTGKALDRALQLAGLINDNNELNPIQLGNGD